MVPEWYFNSWARCKGRFSSFVNCISPYSLPSMSSSAHKKFRFFCLRNTLSIPCTWCVHQSFYFCNLVASWNFCSQCKHEPLVHVQPSWSRVSISHAVNTWQCQSPIRELVLKSRLLVRSKPHLTQPNSVPAHKVLSSKWHCLDHR